MAEIIESVASLFQMSQAATCETVILVDAYGSVERANIYFNNRLRSKAWDRATITERGRALVGATRLIDQLAYKGCRASESQIHQFPRGNDTTVPTDIELACYEIAIRILEGYDPNMEVENLAAVGQGYSSVRTTYDRSFVLEHVRAGIPSSVAWSYLKPYLADPYRVSLSRVD